MIDEFHGWYEGKPAETLATRQCKERWVNIQLKVGTQTHTWKLLMVVICDPLDTKIIVRKYMAGQLQNNVIEIALKVDLGITYSDTSDVKIIEQSSPGDGFDSDLDPADLASVMIGVATQGSPIVASAPSMQSTIMAPVKELENRVATPMALPGPSVPSATATPKNPEKKIKVELDRDVARELARSLSSFASLLQIKDDSSSDSFEVLQED